MTRARRWLTGLQAGGLPLLLGTLITLASVLPAMYIFTIFNDSMRHHALQGDEGYFTWCGWSITRGLAPYRDFMEFKPPIFFLMHALAIKLFGLRNLEYRTFFWLFPMASVVALQLAMVSRKVDRLLALGLSLALIFVWVDPKFHDTALSDSESVGLSFYFLGAACLLVHSRFSKWTTALGTAFLVSCFLSKDPFLPCAFCTWATGFLISQRRGTLKQDFKIYFGYSALGAGAVVVGLLLYMGPTGSLRAYVAMIARYTVVYRDARQSYCVAGGVFQPTTPMNDLVRAFHRVRAEYINLNLLGFLLPFGFVAIVFTARKSPLLLVATLLCVVTGFLAVTASNCPWPHYYNMFLGGFFFFLVIGLVTMAPYLRAIDPVLRVLIQVMMLGGVVVALSPRAQAEQMAYGSRFSPPLPSQHGWGSVDVIMQHTGPNDRIQTTGNPVLYLQVDRRNAIRESTLLDPMLGFYAGDTDVQKLKPLYDELVQSRPKLILLDPEFYGQQARHRAALWMPFIEAEHYKKLTDSIYMRPD